MRMSRRWSESDLQGLDQRALGFKAPPPALSPEAEQLRLAKDRGEKRKLEELFALHLTWRGIRDMFEVQHRFDAVRKWMLDFYCAQYRVGVEIHGATYAQGYHTRGAGFHKDREKINAASLQGITVLEFDKEMLKNGTAINTVEDLLTLRRWVKP